MVPPPLLKWWLKCKKTQNQHQPYPCAPARKMRQRLTGTLPLMARPTWWRGGNPTWAPRTQMRCPQWLPCWRLWPKARARCLCATNGAPPKRRGAPLTRAACALMRGGAAPWPWLANGTKHGGRMARPPLLAGYLLRYLGRQSNGK